MVRSRFPFAGTTIASLVAIVMALILPAVPLFATDCISIQEARLHVGEAKCVMGKVLKVKVGARGVHFVDFCEEQMACPFSVVVFPADLRDVGDVRRLAGHMIEIRGAVKLYDGRAEIVLNHISQISGGAALVPPLPKDYDVENRGRYSAGHLRSKKLKPAKPTPNSTATYGDVEGTESPQ
jgi:hypothetical protein